jgi:hypothetical protein
MPYIEEYRDKEVFMIHNGVTVYHSYKDDDFNHPFDYWYTLNPEDGTPQQDFDVRLLAGYDKDLRHQTIIAKAIDEGILR